MQQVKLSALVAQSKALTTKTPKHIARTVSWWKEHYGSTDFLDAKSIEQMASRQLYRAIVENDIKTAKQILAIHLQLSFIKVFVICGPISSANIKYRATERYNSQKVLNMMNCQRTALYVASCLAKVEIVRLLIRHGADK